MCWVMQSETIFRSVAGGRASTSTDSPLNDRDRVSLFFVGRVSKSNSSTCSRVTATALEIDLHVRGELADVPLNTTRNIHAARVEVAEVVQVARPILITDLFGRRVQK